MSNTFGRSFRCVTWGESHGPAMGVVVDGCPAGVTVDNAILAAFTARDVPDDVLGTRRREENHIEVLSGVFEGKTLGTPVSLMIPNTAVQSHFYEPLQRRPRPGHGDLTYFQRYGHVDWRGGSRASGRECISRLAAAGLAMAMLRTGGVSVSSTIVQLAGITISSSADMERARERAIELTAAGDSSGGMVQVTVSGLPAGLGSPVFGKLEADLAAAILSIGGVKSFAIGVGCESALAKGSTFNDAIVAQEGVLGTESNRAGGVLAGITTGAPVYFQFSVKPTPSINELQRTVDLETGEPVDFRANGHFDANFTPRAAVVAEAMAILVVTDHLLQSGWIHPTRFGDSLLLKQST